MKGTIKKECAALEDLLTVLSNIDEPSCLNIVRTVHGHVSALLKQCAYTATETDYAFGQHGRFQPAPGFAGFCLAANPFERGGGHFPHPPKHPTDGLQHGTPDPSPATRGNFRIRSERVESTTLTLAEVTDRDIADIKAQLELTESYISAKDDNLKRLALLESFKEKLDSIK